MTEYTLTQAAKRVGIGRTTLHTAIKGGRLSARREEDGSYRIDASELARVYPSIPPERSEGSPSKVTERSEKGSEGVGTAEAELRVEVRLLRELLDRERADREHDRATVRDLRERLDAETEERRALQRQIAPPAQQAPRMAQEWPTERLEAAEPLKAAKGFLARLLGL